MAENTSNSAPPLTRTLIATTEAHYDRFRVVLRDGDRIITRTQSLNRQQANSVQQMIAGVIRVLSETPSGGGTILLVRE